PQISLSNTANETDLEQSLRERTEQLAADSSVSLLISWQIACQGPLRFAIRHRSLGAELISKLQRDFSQRQPSIWTLAINAELHDQFPSQWCQEETLRGDFLRAVLQQENNLENGLDPQAMSRSNDEPSHDPNSAALLRELALPENLANLFSKEIPSQLSNH